MQTQKRYRVSNLRLAEISTVDKPAQSGAVAVLLKGAAPAVDVEIRKNAAEVADAGKDVAYTAVDFDAAMLRMAEQIAVERGITPERALLSAISTDPAMMNLAHAANVARAVERGTAIQKRYGAAA